jgi:chromate transporter
MSEVPQKSAREIFLTFTRIGASGFGGVNYWIRRVLVQEKRWITDREYLEGLALGQILPGPNVYNLVVLLVLGVLYQSYGALPMLQRALAGMIAVAAGLLLANALSLAAAMPRRLRPWSFLVLAFAGVGVMRWPLLYVMGALAPFAMAAVWRR